MAFAVAFALLGLGQSAPALVNLPTEERGAVYPLGLVPFAAIIFAIVRKNRAGQSG